jgi:hypothetical protein
VRQYQVDTVSLEYITLPSLIIVLSTICSVFASTYANLFFQSSPKLAS